jgi:hypothetical protein
MVPEARLERTDDGLLPAGEGWFVLNAREARWFDFPGHGRTPALQGKGDFAQLGLGITVLEPGEPMAMAYARYPAPAATRYGEGWLGA